MKIERITEQAKQIEALLNELPEDRKEIATQMVTCGVLIGVLKTFLESAEAPDVIGKLVKAMDRQLSLYKELEGQLKDTIELLH